MVKTPVKELNENRLAFRVDYPFTRTEKVRVQ